MQATPQISHSVAVKCQILTLGKAPWACAVSVASELLGAGIMALRSGSAAQAFERS